MAKLNDNDARIRRALAGKTVTFVTTMTPTNLPAILTGAKPTTALNVTATVTTKPPAPHVQRFGSRFTR